MAGIPLNDWIVIIQASPILDAQQCNALRESIHAGVFNITRIKSVFGVCGDVDFINSHSDLQKILIDTCLNHLLEDDAPADDTGYIYDTIAKQLGDAFLRELDKAVIPTQLRTDILLAIDTANNGNLSTNLQDAITLVKP